MSSFGRQLKTGNTNRENGLADSGNYTPCSVHSRPRHCVIGAIFFFGARKSASARAISAQKKNR